MFESTRDTCLTRVGLSVLSTSAKGDVKIEPLATAKLEDRESSFSAH